MDSSDTKVGALLKEQSNLRDFKLDAHPIFWFQKAKDLRRAALGLIEVHKSDSEAFKERIRGYRKDGSGTPPERPAPVLDQFVLLSAFALENQFKGLILQKHPTLLDKGKVSGDMKGHDLLRLASAAGFLLTPEETRFCEIAQDASVSWGRYPIPSHLSGRVVYRKFVLTAVDVFCSLSKRLDHEYASRFQVEWTKQAKSDA